MAIINYKYTKFDPFEAERGHLCIVLKDRIVPTIGEGEIISASINNGAEIENSDIKGVGICKNDNGSKFYLTSNGIKYGFDKFGNPLPFDKNSIGTYLKLAEITNEVTRTGDDVGSNTSSVTTRGTTGSSTTISADDSQVTVSSLNARDHFAMQALEAILTNINNPTEVSSSVMANYCNAAYEWAAHMMSASASSRSKVERDSGTGSIGTPGSTASGETNGSTSFEEVVPDTNIEKLINNIVFALEKTDGTVREEITSLVNGAYVSTYKTYPAERITAPNIEKSLGNQELWLNDYQTWLDNYVKHTPTAGEPTTKTTVGLDDLISAIKSIASATSQNNSTSIDFSTLINAINNKQTSGTISIGNAGLGRDSSHPIYMSGGGGFPSRALLAAALVASSTDSSKTIHDFLTFNTAGAVGYSTLSEASKAIIASAAVNDIWNKIKSMVDTRISSWLQAARDAENRSLTVNTPT